MEIENKLRKLKKNIWFCDSGNMKIFEIKELLMLFILLSKIINI